MTPDKLSGLLGMCRRSGRLVCGFDAVSVLCREPFVLLMIASDASPRTQKELLFKVSAAGMNHAIYRLPFRREETAQLLGFQKPVAVLATVDKGFAEAIRPLLTTI